MPVLYIPCGFVCNSWLFCQQFITNDDYDKGANGYATNNSTNMLIAITVEVELITAPEGTSVECKIRIGYI